MTIRIFVAGAAGAIGRQLVPMLVGDGHAVTGTTRSAERARWLESVGARAAVLDAYDADAVRAAVLAADAEVVIHQLTDLALGFGPEELAKNSRLREVGTSWRPMAPAAPATKILVVMSKLRPRSESPGAPPRRR